MQSTQTLDDDRLMNLVELAMARPPDERDAYLRSVCRGDDALFGLVWNYVQAEERMNGFLLDPLCPPPVHEHPFSPGEMLEERFRVVREVARGGMGVVYEVVDEKLDRRVAIKCARAGFNKRLPPEVRNARVIGHPNVCRIFEIHTASTSRGEIDFITMEFLDGETLAARLRAGPLPEPEARAIARQLCAGLAEAHRNQVIHGDLKSGNVILTTSAGGAMRAVITDFGLARGLDASLHSAQSAEGGGTPDYMAPELWKGEGASIASDIYALGVILFELASGRRPHPAEESWKRVSWEQRLAWKPPAVHPKWDRILERCLDPDPSRRYRDADEIAEALGPSRSRRWFPATAAAVILAVASGVVTYERATVPKKSVRLAVLPFTSSVETAPLADGLFHDTEAQLNRLKGNAETRFTFLAEKRAAGATQVLHGTLGRENGKVVLDAYLADARSGVGTKEWKSEYAPEEVRYIPVALAGVVTETLHLPPLATGPAVNPAARRDYLAGLNYTRRDSTIDGALPLLERAVATDGDSALTYAGLAEAEWFKYFLTKDPVWLERTAESVRLAQIRNPDLAAVHRIAGLLKMNDGRYEQAAAEFQRAIELEPNNSDAYRRLGEAYKANGQSDQALSAFRRAVELEPDYFKPYQNLGTFYIDTANYTDAAVQFEKMVALAPDEPDAHYALGTAYSDLARYSEAEIQFRSALRLEEAPKTLNNLGVALMYQGRDNEAIPYFSRALVLLPEWSLAWMNLGTAYRRVNKSAQSEMANRRGLGLAEKEISQDPRNGSVRSCLAYLCARLGQGGRAESEITQALQLSPNDALTRWVAAVTYEALGRRNDTLEVLSGSPDAVLADLSRWPDVADLRKDPRFLELLARSLSEIDWPVDFGQNIFVDECSGIRYPGFVSKSFRTCDLDQPFLLPPSLQDWLPENHLARFIAELMNALDLSSIYGFYGGRDAGGKAAYHPVMMVRVLLYGYCVGVMSSRRMERASYEDVAFRYLCADQHPDHDTIAAFRQQHLPVLAQLFTQVLQLCNKAGLVKLGHVAIDGTKVQANASKHKAMSYDRMEEKEKQLKEEVEKLLTQAVETDAAEDALYGKGNRGDELTGELARRDSRLRKIAEAKAALEQEARERAEAAKKAAEEKQEERRKKEEERGKKFGGRPPQIPDPAQARPEAKAQRNFTDPESRIMPDGAHKGAFVQAYNAQIAVDGAAQIIVAAELTQESNDKRQLAPMLERVEQNLGTKPEAATADAGYFSEEQVNDERVKGIELYIATGKQKHGPPDPAHATEPSEPAVEADSAVEKMKRKLKTETGQALYKMRKAIVEPVFGQIKAARGIRAFLLRGFEKTQAEWKLICATHNLLKLFRAGRQIQAA